MFRLREGRALGKQTNELSILDELDEILHIDGMRAEGTRTRGFAGRKAMHFPMRNMRTGEFVTVTERAQAPMPDIKEIGRALALSSSSLTVVLKALHAATTSSRSAGAPLQFAIEVEPNGAMRIVAGPTETSATTAAEEDADLERALDAARARGRHRIADILAGEDMLSAEDFADHLQTTRATINTRRQAHQVLGLQGATRGYRYPIWQIGEDGRPFAALPAIFEALGDSPWAVYRFLTQEHGELDGLTGREALERGRDKATVEAAQSVARAFA